MAKRIRTSQRSDTGFALLKRLTETPGIPGREERVRALVEKEVRGLFDDVRTDALGNLICFKRAAGRARKAPKVMLACHMDEIGFYVRYVDDNGFIRVHNAGGFDPRNLFARRVRVQGREDIIGLMNAGVRPIHISSAEERNKTPEVKDFFIDIGLPAKAVRKLVEVGDPVTLEQETVQVGDAVSGKAMDNRISLWVAINACRRVAAKSKYDVYFVACTQEEVGLRGAETAAYDINPDIGIAIDVTLACDQPGVTKDDAITTLGGGVGIKVMDSSLICNRALVDEFVAVAKRKKIPYQLEILPRGGTDAGAVQRARSGSRAITLSVPCRNIHTVTEMLHREDMDAAVDLLAAWLTT